MHFLGRLLGTLLPLIVGRGVVAWYVYQSAFPLAGAQLPALRLTLLLGIALELGAVAVVLASLARPIATVLDRGFAAVDGATEAAAAAAHRLPSRAAAVVALAALGTGAAYVAALRQGGLALDLAVAAAAIALALAILSGMIAHSLVAALSAAAVERLGARAELAARRTVRGKILVVAFGLNTIGVLLFAATGYVRYRVDFDEEYVAAASRAQQATIAALGARSDAELASHVWVVTGAASALVDAGGAVVARFGPADAPLRPAGGPPAAGTQRLEDGWLVTTRAPRGAVVASWLPEEPLRERRRQFLEALVSMALVVYFATALLAWVAARAITTPFRTLGRAADRIASGDLTASPPSVSRDEIGQLASDFRRMAQGLKALVVDVQGASAGVSAGAREAAAIGERVRAGAVGEHAGVVTVQAAVEAMESSMLLVSDGVGGLSEYVAGTNRAMTEMAAAFEEVSKEGAELERAMEAAIADVDHLSTAGGEAEARLGHLEALADHAGQTLAAVRASMSTLERAATESEATAELVAEMAERAGGVVEETVHGIESLRAAVADAHQRVSALGRRSDDIDQVVDFISEVAGRTNLLSLNASIIAAQAGEHGKPFGVVADQNPRARGADRALDEVDRRHHPLGARGRGGDGRAHRPRRRARGGGGPARAQLARGAGAHPAHDRARARHRDGDPHGGGRARAVVGRGLPAGGVRRDGVAGGDRRRPARGAERRGGELRVARRGRDGRPGVPSAPRPGGAREAAEREPRPSRADDRGHRTRGGEPPRGHPARARGPAEPVAHRGRARDGGRGAGVRRRAARRRRARARRARRPVQGLAVTRARHRPPEGSSRG